MKVIDIATSIWIDLGSPTSVGIPAISYWVRNKIGELNTLIYSTYSIDSNYEIADEDDEEICEKAVAILKKMYMVYHYDVKIRENLGAAASDVVEITQGGDTIRLVNRNEISKTYAQMKKSEAEDLDKLLTSYKIGKSTPLQVKGDDDIPENSAIRYYPNE